MGNTNGLMWLKKHFFELGEAKNYLSMKTVERASGENNVRFKFIHKLKSFTMLKTKVLG